MLCATEHRVVDTWSVLALRKVLGHPRPRPAWTPSSPGARPEGWQEVGRHNHRPLLGPTAKPCVLGRWVRERVSERVIFKPRPGG